MWWLFTQISVRFASKVPLRRRWWWWCIHGVGGDGDDIIGGGWVGRWLDRSPACQLLECVCNSIASGAISASGTANFHLLCSPRSASRVQCVGKQNPTTGLHRTHPDWELQWMHNWNSWNIPSLCSTPSWIRWWCGASASQGTWSAPSSWCTSHTAWSRPVSWPRSTATRRYGWPRSWRSRRTRRACRSSPI